MKTPASCAAAHPVERKFLKFQIKNVYKAIETSRVYYGMVVKTTARTVSF